MPQMPLDDADSTRGHPRVRTETSQSPAPAFARVPCNLLDAILDAKCHDSAYAAHLLAIRVTKGVGFALNEIQVAKSFDQGGYEIGRRGFRAGIALLGKPAS